MRLHSALGFSADSVRKLLRDLVPAWAIFSIASFVKNLGFPIGPGSVASRWTANLFKFETRIDLIRSLNCGLAAAIVLFNAIALTIFSHTCQLYEPPPEVVRAVEESATKIIRAPGNLV